MLRRIFGSEDEVAAERVRPHMENLYYLWPYCSPNIILVIISSRMKWVELVARKRDKGSVHRDLV